MTQVYGRLHIDVTEKLRFYYSQCLAIVDAKSRSRDGFQFPIPCKMPPDYGLICVYCLVNLASGRRF